MVSLILNNTESHITTSLVLWKLKLRLSEGRHPGPRPHSCCRKSELGPDSDHPALRSLTSVCHQTTALKYDAQTSNGAGCPSWVGDLSVTGAGHAGGRFVSVCECVCMHTCAYECHSTHIEATCGKGFFLSTVRVLGVELGSPGFAVSVFTPQPSPQPLILVLRDHRSIGQAILSLTGAEPPSPGAQTQRRLYTPITSGKLVA